MRIKYFGDSYDFVKRSILECLADVGPWSALPMFTEPVERQQVDELQSFLGVPLLSSADVTRVPRSEYFAGTAKDQHLFLDPNTGLSLREFGGRKAADYLFASELLLLAEHRPKFLTMVFDQSLNRTIESVRRAQVADKLGQLKEKGLFGFAYYSHACFLVLSKDKTVATEAKECLHRRLGLARLRLLGE